MITIMLVAVMQLGQVVVMELMLVVKSEVSLGEEVRNTIYCIAVLIMYILFVILFCFVDVNKFSLQ